MSRRHSKKPWHRLYSTKAWQAIRKCQLDWEPLCKYCLLHGRATPATVVDHIEPHKGDETKFFNPRNLQSLCKLCHDGAKHREEVIGKSIGCDVSGTPLDAGHHWNGEGVGKS